MSANPEACSVRRNHLPLRTTPGNPRSSGAPPPAHAADGTLTAPIDAIANPATTNTKSRFMAATLDRFRYLMRGWDGLEGRGHSVLDVGVEERGVVGGNDELDFAEHVERAAARHAVHRRDHRLPQVATLGSDVGSGVVEHERRAAAADHLLVV